MKILLAAAALVASVLAQELDWDLINKGPQPIPEAYKATDYSEQLLSLGFADVVDLGQAAVNAPSNCNGVDTYMGGTFFANTAFDILLCAVACINETLYDQANPPAGLSAPRTCQFFNAFCEFCPGLRMAHTDSTQYYSRTVLFRANSALQ